MASRLLSLGKKLLVIGLLLAAVVAAVVVYEIQAWKSDAARFARLAAVKAGHGELSFSIHFADARTTQVREMVRLLLELRLGQLKLRSAENFGTRSGWGSRTRRLDVPGVHFDRAAGYVRFAISIRDRAAADCYPVLREIVVNYLAAQPDLTGATLRICDEGGVLFQQVCDAPQALGWPPANLPEAGPDSTPAR